MRFKNGLKTAALLGLMTALILVIGNWLAGTTGLVVALFVALAMNFGTYYWSDKIALGAMRARPVSEAQFPELYQMVRELSQQAGPPMPRLYLIPIPQPNAFATGRNPANAAVCVTQGIVGLLNYRELRGVIGHELAHVYNRDILISTVAAALSGVVTMLAHFAFLFGGRDNVLGSLRVCSARSPRPSSNWRSAAAASSRPMLPAPSSPATRWPWRAPCGRSPPVRGRGRCRPRGSWPPAPT